MQRQILCRFPDTRAFLRHLHDAAGRSPRKLSFLGDFGISTDEILRVTLIIDELGERQDLHMRLLCREAMSKLTDDRVRWRYTAEATAEDAIWLEMLAQKCSTSASLREPTFENCDSARPCVA
jgi:hypothetical protein